MKTNKLIKLSDTHYIVVDDSEIKEGDKSLLKVEGFQPMILTHFEPVEEGYEGKKITHSTQPLEYTTEDHLHWDKIKPLSLSEVEEAIYGYKTKFLKFFENEPNYKNYWKPLIESNPQLIEVHKELVKDKLFTVEDMFKAIKLARQDFDEEGHTIDIKHPTEIIQSLLPKTEWECTITPEGNRLRTLS